LRIKDYRVYTEAAIKIKSVSSNGHAQDAADQHLKEFKEKLAHQEYELKVIESVIHVIQRQLKAAGVSAC
jgi:hypothetical protein